MADIVELLDYYTFRFGSETQNDANIRRAQTLNDAKTEIATLRADLAKAVEGLEWALSALQLPVLPAYQRDIEAKLAYLIKELQP